ncbi:uncharacterized protein LOC110924448 [Helianthus annuus]|uniref:uncharacterized protein LOC110924448 n=1 Tax=Helianthus annuus TaxID=4232 RepID=UPI000B8F5098|nr:uncharacterized protein LOC110924448 [Helianthus annuus]
MGTFRAFLECKPPTFDGTGGTIDILHWIRRIEYTFEESESPAGKRVEYATVMFQGKAYSWWNAQVQMLGLADANATLWSDFKDLIKEEFCHLDDILKLEIEYYGLKMEGSEIEAYTKRSNDLAALYPNMSQPIPRRIKLYLRGLVPEIQGSVSAANLRTIQQVVRLAHQLTDQAVEEGKLPKSSSSNANALMSNKYIWGEYQGEGPSSIRREPHRKLGLNYQNQGGYLGNKPRCRKCQRHHSGSCAESYCHRCKKLGHMARDCRSPYPANRNQRQHQQGNERCYQCGAESHFKRNCPQMRQNRDNSGNQGNRKNNGDNKDNRRTSKHELLNGQEEKGNNLNVVVGKFYFS